MAAKCFIFLYRFLYFFLIKTFRTKLKKRSKSSKLRITIIINTVGFDDRGVVLVTAADKIKLAFIT